MTNKAITEEELHKELDIFNVKMKDTLEKIIAPVRTSADKSYKYLFGNGEPGLDEKVRSLESKIDTLIKIFTFIAVSIGGYVLVQIVQVLLDHFGA